MDKLNGALNDALSSAWKTKRALEIVDQVYANYFRNQVIQAHIAECWNRGMFRK